MSRFTVGQTVWSGRGSKIREMVVDKVHKNPRIPIHQYSFKAPFDGFFCGEQSIRATKDGRDLTLSECFVKDKEADTRVNTIASALRTEVSEQNSMINLPKMSTFDSFRVDFKPSLEMCEWLKEYADGRVIIHVGSGQGHLVRMLKMTRAKVIGIEPNFNKDWWLKFRIHRDGENFDSINEILEGTVGRYKKLISGMGDKALLIFARPKVFDFVIEGLQNMPKEMEALYIDTEFPEELNEFVLNTTLLKHKGVSEDNEVVISIKK
jgi:hypothetical protein